MNYLKRSFKLKIGVIFLIATLIFWMLPSSLIFGEGETSEIELLQQALADAETKLAEAQAAAESTALELVAAQTAADAANAALAVAQAAAGAADSALAKQRLNQNRQQKSWHRQSRL